jgi:hypothetical protein
MKLGGGAICGLEGRGLGQALAGGGRNGNAIVGCCTTGVEHCDGPVHSGYVFFQMRSLMIMVGMVAIV